MRKRQETLRLSILSVRMMRNSYFDLVYGLVMQIPRGKVTTYGEIANKLKVEDACLPARQGKWKVDPRMVGWALSANREPKVPCHRVVDRNGRLAPNFAGPPKPWRRRAFDGWEEQRRRLVAEGIKFKDNMHVDLEECLWQ